MGAADRRATHCSQIPLHRGKPGEPSVSNARWTPWALCSGRFAPRLCCLATLGCCAASWKLDCARPGLIAAAAFAFLVPVAKSAAGHRAPSIASSFGQLPKSYWHFLAGVFAHGIGDFAPTLLILRASQILSSRDLAMGAPRQSPVGLYTFLQSRQSAAACRLGAIGDRIGKRGLLALGYLIGAIACAGFFYEPPTIPILVVLFGWQ